VPNASGEVEIIIATARKTEGNFFTDLRFIA
jgi:hypothetical protein